MPNRMDLPPELASLIEKREAEDRRKQEQAAKEVADAKVDQEERRSGADRRSNES